MASTSRAARAEFAAASACGTVAGSRPRAFSVSSSCWDESDGSQVLRRLQPQHPGTRLPRPGEREAPDQAGGDVVRVALDLADEVEHGLVVHALLAVWHEGTAGEHSGDDRRRGRAESRARAGCGCCNARAGCRPRGRDAAWPAAAIGPAGATRRGPACPRRGRRCRCAAPRRPGRRSPRRGGREPDRSCRSRDRGWRRSPEPEQNLHATSFVGRVKVSLAVRRSLASSLTSGRGATRPRRRRPGRSAASGPRRSPTRGP